MLDFFKRRRPRPPARTTARRLFHGVSIKTADSFICEAAGGLLHRRFLAEETPHLPLDGCSNPQNCKCVYQHHDDRRTDIRRESDQGLPAKDYSEDVRLGVGRRVTDS